MPLLQGFFNSVKLTICVTILQLATSSFAAYAFAKLEFKGRDLIFMMYIMTIAIPWQVYMVPQYKMMTAFHLIDSHLGLVLMHAFTATGVFLMRQFPRHRFHLPQGRTSVQIISCKEEKWGLSTLAVRGLSWSMAGNMK